MVLGIGAESALCPSVAHHNTKHIVAWLQQICYIVCINLHQVIYAGTSRFEVLIADPFSVDLQPIKTQSGYIQARLPDSGDMKILSDIWADTLILP